MSLLHSDDYKTRSTLKYSRDEISELRKQQAPMYELFQTKQDLYTYLF